MEDKIDEILNDPEMNLRLWVKGAIKAQVKNLLLEARKDEVKRISRGRIMGVTDVLSYRTTRLSELQEMLNNE